MSCYPWNDIMDRNCFLLRALDTMGTPISSWLDQLYSSPVTSDNQTAKKHQGISTILYFQRKIVLIFVTIWTQICLHYNVSKRSSVKNIFLSSNGDLPECSVWLSTSGVGRVEFTSLITSVDFLYLPYWWLHRFFILAVTACTTAYLHSTSSSPASSNE